MNGPALFKRWRLAHGFTQVQAGALLKVSGAIVSCWESGKKAPGTTLIIRIDVLTKGEVPIESWSDDPKVRAAMRAILERRALALTSKPPRKPATRRRVSTAPPEPTTADAPSAPGPVSAAPPSKPTAQSTAA